jgi:hypothetical protein
LYTGNQAFADYSAILGGSTNISGDPDLIDHTIGRRSTVSGGTTNTASGTQSSVSGGFDNTASGNYASVSGGYENWAAGTSSSVSGGSYGSVVGAYDWRAGELFEDN